MISYWHDICQGYSTMAILPSHFTETFSRRNNVSQHVCKQGLRPAQAAGLLILFATVGASGQTAQGEQANFQGRVTQGQIVNGELTLREIRLAGLRVFTTPFNKLDGYGDGDADPGGRPTLQGNGTLLRVNGLDGQTCLECHSLLSAATVPPRLGIGGVGGSVTNAIIKPTAMDPADLDFDKNTVHLRLRRR
jgi:hypothetical protein